MYGSTPPIFVRLHVITVLCVSQVHSVNTERHRLLVRNQMALHFSLLPTILDFVFFSVCYIYLDAVAHRVCLSICCSHKLLAAASNALEYTALFEMIVGVLTTYHTQYT